MTLNTFVTDAIRTESRIEKVTLNTTFFDDLTQSIIALGTILDQVKKNTFYKKPYDRDKIQDLLELVRVNVLMMIEDVETDYWQAPVNVVDTKVNTRFFHSVVGIVTESVELLQALKLDSPDVDKVNLLEEFGDLAWYQAIGIDEAGGSFDQVLDRVIAKLRARFPEKFTNENAINRDLEKERQILEGNQPSAQ